MINLDDNQRFKISIKQIQRQISNSQRMYNTM